MKAGFFPNSSSATGAGRFSARLFSAIVAVMALLVSAHEAVAATPPAAPTGLVGKQTALRQITLTWDDPGDSSITGYEYCAVSTSKDNACGETGGIDSTNWHPVPGSNHRSTAHTFSVGSAREYQVSIRARNAHGLSDKAIDDEVVVHPLPEVQLFKDSYRLSRLAVGEGRQETFGVSLSGIAGSSRRPLAEVVVAIVGTGDEGVTVTPATLTFTQRNSARLQTVTVKAARDADGDDGEAVFTLTARSSDTGCLRDGEDCVSPLDMGYDGVSARVTVTVDDDNVAPEFGGEASFEVAENAVSVGTVVATDADDGDAVTGYAIAGGADGAQFSIDATTGALRFEAAPDYESPQDGDQDNRYVVVVEATGGSGDREWSATQSVTVTVTDVDEAPGAPAALAVSGETPGGFTVSWTAPANTGPAITDYDVQYRAGTSGAWADAGHEGTERTLTLTGLDAETAYQVQVRATNAEGTGVWSAAATGTTQASPNTAPEFSGDASFEVAENVASVGTVVATDADDGDTITGYAITGGADGARFAIDGATGALRFVAAPDYENPTDGASRVPGDTAGNNEYLVVVTATSGSGDRALTATQAIAVTVTDVAEPPGAPAAAIPDATSDGFTVSWTAPANTGPEVSQYIVRYRVGGSGAFTKVQFSGAVTATTLTGLSAGTNYQVNVRARNAEGRSTWSRRVMAATLASPNAAPEFDTDDVFSVSENTSSVAMVSATDVDDGDGITGYAITGGADGARFAIDGATGALRFAAAPDYEAPGDVLSGDPSNAAGNNEYVVVVEATSGPGERARTAEQTITVTVTDVDEPPAAPAAPAVSNETSGGFTVSWTAPANTGPVITDYDVQYRAGSSGEWVDAGHEGPGRTLALTGLSAETDYQVQVRATNAEGTGVWSEAAATATLASPNTVIDRDDWITFEVRENESAVGRLPAHVRNTTIEGGVKSFKATSADGSRFWISNGGEIVFRQAPDYERPADVRHRSDDGFRSDASDNEYIFKIDIREIADWPGTPGLRVGRSWSAIVRVRVLDVDEPPGLVPRPRVTEPAAHSLTLDWERPWNTGPEITDYDIQYRAGSAGDWNDFAHSGAETKRTVSALSAGTSYQLRVRASNAEGLGNWSEAETGTTLNLPNAAPAFDNDDEFSVSENTVSENTVSVATVSATDVDEGDGITGYAITGGADGARFAIDGATGALRFAAAPDYEAPGDVLSGDPSNAAGNNEYVVVVEATSGSGERARTAEQTITVTVTDVDEPPAAPAAPAVSNETSGGFTVSWTAPANTGPAITDYDVQYRAGSSGEWTDAGHEGTGLSLALTGLAAGTAYQVQVRATNAEGTGVWSEAAPAATLASPNAAPEFDTDDVFSVSENTVSVAMVSATDVDDGDGITGYAITGGVDGARFAIDGATGALRFAVAPNYEAPGDVLSGDPSNAAGNNEYVVVVEATGGSGERARTAEQTITVTVTDVDEAPGAPVALAVSGETASGFTVSWTAPSNTGPVITDYDVQYRAGSSGEWADAGHEGTERTLALTGLDAATAYRVQVRAVNAEGMGVWSEAVGETAARAPEARLPGKATGLTAEPGDRRVRLAWDALGDASVTKWQYRVRSPGNRNFHAWQNIPGSGAETTSYTAAGGRLRNGETYDFQVRAVNGAPIGTGAHRGAGPASKVVSVRLTEGATPVVSGVTLSSNEITVKEYSFGPMAIHWFDTHYTMVLDSKPRADVTVSISKRGIPGINLRPTSITFTPSNWNTHQKVQVGGGAQFRTRHADENTLVLSHTARSRDPRYNSVPIADVVATKQFIEVPTPERLEITVPEGEVSLGLLVPEGRSTSSSAYEEVVRNVGDGDKFRVSAGGRLEFKTPPDFESGGDNEYFVRVRVSWHFSSFRVEFASHVDVTVRVTDVENEDTPQNAPTGLVATPGDRQVTLAWDAMDDPAVTKWQYRMKPSLHANYHAWKDMVGSSAETTSYTVTRNGLVNGETYDFQVRAVNGAMRGEGRHVGAGPASNVARVTVRAAPAAAGVTVSALEVTVPEGGTESYTVALESRPSASVTIAVAKQPGGDDDLRAAPASLEFTPVELGCRTDGDGECGRGRGRRRRSCRFRSHGDERRLRLPGHRDCFGDGGGARHDVRDSVLIRRRRDGLSEEPDDQGRCALRSRARQQAERKRDRCGEQPPDRG